MLSNLVKKIKDSQQPAHTARLPDKTTTISQKNTTTRPQATTISEDIPDDVLNILKNVASKYEIPAQAIVDRYKQICKLTTMTPEAIDDLKNNVLLDITGKEASWLYAFVKPIQAGCLNTTPEDTTPETPRHYETKLTYKGETLHKLFTTHTRSDLMHECVKAEAIMSDLGGTSILTRRIHKLGMVRIDKVKSKNALCEYLWLLYDLIVERLSIKGIYK